VMNWSTLATGPVSGLRNSRLILCFRGAGACKDARLTQRGQPPVDLKSDLSENQPPPMARYKEDKIAQKALAESVRLSDMKSEDFDTIFYVGGTV
jgi:hypothetical protein